MKNSTISVTKELTGLGMEKNDKETVVGTKGGERGKKVKKSLFSYAKVHDTL
jgi:hypothetical protein